MLPLPNRPIQPTITMIEQLTPTTRVLTLTAALLVLQVGLLASARAADKPLPQTTDTARRADLDRQREAHQRGVRFLEDELAKREAEVKKMEQSVDALRQTLQIVDSDEPGATKGSSEAEV